MLDIETILKIQDREAREAAMPPITLNTNERSVAVFIDQVLDETSGDVRLVLRTPETIPSN